MPLNWKTWVNWVEKPDWNNKLWNNPTLEWTVQQEIANVGSAFAGKVDNITDDSNHNPENNDSRMENEKFVDTINARLSMFDWDALKLLLEWYIKLHKLDNLNVCNWKRHFFMSNFHNFKGNNPNLWINNINLFDRKQLGLLCWVLYWEPSNAITQYKIELQQQ
jgi:hypothetical protein